MLSWLSNERLEKWMQVLWGLVLLTMPVTSFRWLPDVMGTTHVRPMAFFPLALLVPVLFVYLLKNHNFPLPGASRAADRLSAGGHDLDADRRYVRSAGPARPDLLGVGRPGLALAGDRDGFLLGGGAALPLGGIPAPFAAVAVCRTGGNDRVGCRSRQWPSIPR